MTINMLLMFLTLAVGAGTSQSIESNSIPCPIGYVCRIEPDCWINGVWYNPCPNDAPDGPELTPKIKQPI